MHGSRELARLFPLLEAPPPWDNVKDWEPFHVDGVEHADEVEDELMVHGNLPWPREGVAARGETGEVQSSAARFVEQVVADRSPLKRPPGSRHCWVFDLFVCIKLGVRRTPFFFLCSSARAG